MINRIDTNGFIKQAKVVHGDKYDYSLVEYKNTHTKVKIICPIHGMFEQTPKDHKNGQGCPKCGKLRSIDSRRDNLESFLEKLYNKFPDLKDKYDFSESVYINTNTKIKVRCKCKDGIGNEHGYFEITPNNLLVGNKCSKCSKRYQMSTQEFIEKARQIHGDKYDYSESEYKTMKTKVKIKCNKCGFVFEQFPDAHLKGQGCRMCFKNTIGQKLSIGKEKFVSNSMKKHGDKYIYSKVEYINNRVPVTITCPIHGDFQQTPHNHMAGEGCPYCKESKLERSIANLLDENGLVYSRESTEISKRMKMDFLLKEKNVVIECQGIQHFEPTSFNTINRSSSVEDFKKNMMRDLRKYNKCREKGITLLYYTNIDVEKYDIFNNPLYNGIYNKENFYTDKDILLERIRNESK